MSRCQRFARRRQQSVAVPCCERFRPAYCQAFLGLNYQSWQVAGLSPRVVGMPSLCGLTPTARFVSEGCCMTPLPYRRWIKRMIRYRYWLLGFAAVLGVAAALTGRGLQLDRSIESMFAPDDPILVPYHRMQRTFGEYEVVLAMYADDKLATDSGIARVKQVQ